MWGVRVATAVVASAVGFAGCGGGNPRQDENEPAGQYRLDVVTAEFPSDQSIAERSTFKLAVRNADSKTVPNVAVTIKTDPGRDGNAPVAFGQRVEDPQLADPSRPVWIVDSIPEGSAVAHTNTWALGRLAPGETRTFEWRVTAVKPGDYRIGYEVFPGLDGKARLAEGSDKATGAFSVNIDDRPPTARVGENGEVIRGEPEDDSN